MEGISQRSVDCVQIQATPDPGVAPLPIRKEHRITRSWQPTSRRKMPQGGAEASALLVSIRFQGIRVFYLIHHFPPRMRRSIQRWAHNTIPRRKTGNKSNSELSGHYLFLLVLFKMIWPQANYYECIAFIANETPNAKIFNQKAVSRALRRLGYTRKVTSTVAYQALTDRNLRRREMFFTRQWPYGIMGTPRRRLIDIDEFGLHLNAANRKYGSSPVGLKIRKPGH